MTTRETLCSHGGYFSAVLGETGSQMSDSASSLCVDRDSAPFRHILSWMRTNRLPYAVTADIAQLDAVAEEARFYALAPLEQQCEQAMARLRELEAAQARHMHADRGRSTPRVTDHKTIFQYQICEPYHANDRLIAMSQCLEKLDKKVNKMIAEGWQPLGPCQTFWDSDDSQSRHGGPVASACNLQLPPQQTLMCQWQQMPSCTSVVCECMQKIGRAHV